MNNLYVVVGPDYSRVFKNRELAEKHAFQRAGNEGLLYQVVELNLYSHRSKVVFNGLDGSREPGLDGR